VLVELSVRDLGVIEEAGLRLGSGLTALTGETGAGKTLLVEALDLLLGGRADAALVRAGAAQAVVEGRFSGDGPPGAEPERVFARELPAEGRSRAYLDGRMATVAALAEAGADLVDLHGQHAHQSLLHQGAQRDALDRFAGVDLGEVRQIEARLAALAERQAELGGDERTLAREVDLLDYQVRELGAAALEDPDEEESLEAEESVLAAAEALRMAATRARMLLAGSDGGPGSPGGGPDGGDLVGAADLAGQAASALGAHAQLADLVSRLTGVSTELDDLAGELRQRAERYEDDPVRLAEVQQRRRLLAELRRKYGESLGDVLAFRDSARGRLADLQAGESLRAELEAERSRALGALAAAEERVGGARRSAAPRLAVEIEAHLARLALPKARLEIEVPPTGLGDAVEWRFGANPGEPALPLSKVASGGELARAMLATRLVLSEAPPTLVFDEVDAGIGGEAALAVGRALHQLARRRQVLVVTHLAQVAAFADVQIAVSKEQRDGRTVASVREVAGEERLVELSRMLSGQPDSAAARRHAEELLAVARG
jgi:DNA repair protein RecN (Recombination protein N)